MANHSQQPGTPSQRPTLPRRFASFIRDWSTADYDRYLELIRIHGVIDRAVEQVNKERAGG